MTNWLSYSRIIYLPEIFPMFMTFDEFKEGLGSWQEPLKAFINSPTFQQIYNYVKG